MFSQVFCKNTDPIALKDENTADNSVIRQVQGSSSEATDAQSSACKWKGCSLESAGTAPPAKYQRLELESEEKLNSWDLLPELASYVNRYMTTHRKEKKIREKILINIPVLSNLKVFQKLNKYMQELAQKAKTLSFEKRLKGIQDKVVLTLAPLIKSMSIMEDEKELMPTDEQVEGFGVIVVSRLFD